MAGNVSHDPRKNPHSNFRLLTKSERDSLARATKEPNTEARATKEPNTELRWPLLSSEAIIAAKQGGGS